jgi:hypothetical protein
MSEATQQTISMPAVMASAGDAALPPEETLARFTEVLSRCEDDMTFRREMVDFTRAQTGARAALLMENTSAGEPRLVHVSAAPNVSTGFVTAPEVKGLTTSALKLGQSVQAGIKLDGVTHVLLGVAFETGKENPPQLLGLLLGPSRAPFVGPIFTILHLLTRAFVEREQATKTEAFRAGFLQSTLLVDLFSRACLAPTMTEAVSIVAREVREFSGCSRVAIGVGRGARMKVEGISGIATIEPRSHGTRLLASALRECVGLEKIVAWPPIETSGSKVWPATDQTELLDAFAVKQMICLPLITTEGREVGAWAFFFKGGEPFSPRKLSLMEAATPHAAALVDLIRSGKPRGIRGAMHRFWSTASKFKKGAMAAGTVLFILLCAIPMPHRVKAACEVQPKMIRQVAAPFDAILDEVAVKPGDAIQKDSVLATLDGKQIIWQYAQAVAQKAMAEKKRDLNRSLGRPVAEVMMAQLEADAADVQVNLLGYQKDHLEIRSPIDGFVLTGSLERSKGVPVAVGQKLFDIGPIDPMILEIAVEDSDIGWVEPGMELTMRLEARPQEKFKSTVKEVYPVSEPKDSQNVFVCLAEIRNEDSTLRPGMRGQAKIMSGYRPLGWIIFHKLWEFIRLHL